MPVRAAELSSLATALDELTARVTAHADAADAAKDEESARELFAIERSLTSANRRLARLATTLSRR
jgi:HAMP domain-containing protein